MTISRNSPCSCGSNKKYKQCCGSLGASDACGPAAAEATPDSAALLREGWQLQTEGRLQEAAILYQRVLNAEPDNADALNLAGLLSMQGGRADMAAALIEKAIMVNPGVAAYHNNLGNALRGLENLQRATQAYRRALELSPEYAKAHNNLGVCLKELGQMKEAVACFKEAARLDPDFAEAFSNLGNAMRDLAQLKEAGEYLRKALALKADYADAHFNYAAVLLGSGDLFQGWLEFGWRFKKVEHPIPVRNFPQPWWQGEDLSGKTLLVWGEQGLGDEMMYASVLPDALIAAKRVILECDPRLKKLFARSFPRAEVIGRTDPPDPRLLNSDIDFQIPAGSLPRWYRSSIERFPEQAGYLVPDPLRVEYWKRWLDGLGAGQKVGIAWRSMRRNADRNMHYTDLSQWGEILKVPGVVFVNLQYDNCKDELAQARNQFNVAIHEAEGINLKDDLDEVAALTKALDLVVSAGTSVVGMAGAIGAPAWMFTLESYWAQLGAGHLPWMPSVRLYHKQWDAPWEPVLKTIAEDLSRIKTSNEAGCVLTSDDKKKGLPAFLKGRF